MTFADVHAGVLQALATYTQALDDGRLDDLVATFCPDGRVAIPGLAEATGPEQLRAAYEPTVPRRPQRHVVSSTAITRWTEDEATAVSDVTFLLQRKEGWSVMLVGRYTDVLHRDGDRWLFHHRAAQFDA